MTAVLTSGDGLSAGRARDVRDVLGRSILTDGLDLVLDLDRSGGSYLVDARDEIGRASCRERVSTIV